MAFELLNQNSLLHKGEACRSWVTGLGGAPNGCADSGRNRGRDGVWADCGALRQTCQIRTEQARCISERLTKGNSRERCSLWAVFSRVRGTSVLPQHRHNKLADSVRRRKLPPLVLGRPTIRSTSVTSNKELSLKGSLHVALGYA